MGVTQRRDVESPQGLAAGDPGDEVVHHVGRERAGDLRFDLALRAVVEQRACGVHLRRRMGEVVGQGLVAVGATVRGQVADRLADHALGEVDHVGCCVEVGSAHRSEL